MSQHMDIQEGPIDCFYREVSDAERANICQKLNYLKTALRGQYLHRVRLEPSTFARRFRLASNPSTCNIVIKFITFP